MSDNTDRNISSKSVEKRRQKWCQSQWKDIVNNSDGRLTGLMEPTFHVDGNNCTTATCLVSMNFAKDHVSCYAGKSIKIEIFIPNNYICEPPVLRFVDEFVLDHPHVRSSSSSKTWGFKSCNCNPLKDSCWSPAVAYFKVLEMVYKDFANEGGLIDETGLPIDFSIIYAKAAEELQTVYDQWERKYTLLYNELNSTKSDTTAGNSETRIQIEHALITVRHRRDQARQDLNAAKEAAAKEAPKEASKEPPKEAPKEASKDTDAADVDRSNVTHRLVSMADTCENFDGSRRPPPDKSYIDNLAAFHDRVRAGGAEKITEVLGE